MPTTGNERLKIAHVVPSLSKGGGERVVVDLANAQAANDHDVTVILGRALGDVPSKVLDKRVKVLIIKEPGAGKMSLYAAVPTWQLRHHRWLRSLDVLHCHLSFGAIFGTLASLLLRPWHKRPVIVETYHAVGMAISKQMRSLHATMIAKRDAVVFMAKDPYWDRFLTARPGLKAALIENGVTSSTSRLGTAGEILEKKAALGLPAHARIVGTVGQLRPDRQPWLHIELFSRIAKIVGKDVQFLIAGDGPARPRVEAAIAEAGLVGQVTLLGVTDSAVEPASLMDLYVTVAVGPVVGIAALEAMFAGVPTIAIQFNPDWSAKESDLVWSSSNLSEVAQCAQHLLSDLGGLTALGQAQQQAAIARYDVAAISRKYDKVYTSAILSR